MSARNNNLTKTQEAMLLAVLEALNAHACITSYTIDGTKSQPAWTEHGFDRAFEELKSNPHPLGLKKKGERALLEILLARKDKKVVDEWLFSRILE